MFKYLLIFISAISLISCEKVSNTEKEIQEINVDYDLIRFDKEFAMASPEELPKLKGNYPYLFPAQFPDSIWVQKMNDSIQLELNTEVLKAFPEFTGQEDQLHDLFQHIEYYFPEFSTPTVITITSEVDYKNKVILSDDFLFIALDTYLGEDHRFYLGIQEFLKKNFRKEQVIPDVAQAYAEALVPKPETRTFLSHMLYYGKIQYLKELWLPSISEEEIIGYTQEELQWARNNEEQIWRFFVEKEVIFDTDSKLYTRFLYPAPFSKFYLLLDSESPDRLGQYIGWKIIQRYMDKNEVSVKKMLNTDAETIFNNANYKPVKND